MLGLSPLSAAPLSTLPSGVVDLALTAGQNTVTLTAPAQGQVVAIRLAAGQEEYMASGNLLAVFTPQQNEPPTSNPATFDLRNGHLVLDFDTTTQEIAIFRGIMPRHYSGGGLTVYVHASLTSAITGTLGWDVTFERVSDSQQDIDSDGFATAQTITAATVPGTSGHVFVLNVAITAGAAGTDNIAAGEGFRLRIRRDVANDTAAGDAELWAVEVKET